MRYVNSILLDVNANQVLVDNEVILNAADSMHNYSRIPGSRMNDDNFDTVLELIRKNLEAHTKTIRNDDAPNVELFIMVDALVSDFFMHRSGSLKVAEIGCNNGIISFHLAPLIAAYDPSAAYACVCSTIGNDSGNEWLDLISQVNTPEGLSLHAADFSDTALRDDYFDLTFINGTVMINDPVSAIKEAARITNANGTIICFSDDQVLLDDSFRMLFTKRRGWRITDRFVLFEALKTDIEF